MFATWLADVLRAEGLEVVEHAGWKTRGNGSFDDLRAVVWHHDGSPVGDSPGVPAYMIRNWSKAGANCWVDLRGRWHLVGAGVSYHAGRVLPGKPGNTSSIGVETDHTTGETWSGVLLLDSLRRGTAAILRFLDRPVLTGLEFHSSICRPVGRKTDPDALDLHVERAAVAGLLAPPRAVEGDLLMSVAHNDHDARWAQVLEWFLLVLGRVPTTSEEHDFHVKVLAERGAGACLAGIALSPEAKRRRGEAA